MRVEALRNVSPCEPPHMYSWTRDFRVDPVPAIAVPPIEAPVDRACRRGKCPGNVRLSDFWLLRFRDCPDLLSHRQRIRFVDVVAGDIRRGLPDAARGSDRVGR